VLLDDLSKKANWIPTESKWVENQRQRIDTNARKLLDALTNEVSKLETASAAEVDRQAFLMNQQLTDLLRNFNGTEWEPKFQTLLDRVRATLSRLGMSIENLKAGQIDALMKRADRYMADKNFLMAHVCYHTIVTRFAADPGLITEAKSKIGQIDVASRGAGPLIRQTIEKARDAIFGSAPAAEADAARASLRELLVKYPLTPYRPEILHLLETK
jgi:hypothetical protein